MKKEFKLAGHVFTLKHIQYGIHSEETVDFIADLFCDGKLLCVCENDGHGGSTYTYCPNAETRDRYFEVLQEVSKEVWLVCQTGDVIYHNLGTVADEVLDMHLLHNEVKKYQRDAIVFQNADKSKNDYYIRTKPLGTTMKIMVEQYPGALAKYIADLQDEGWEVLNSNIPLKIMESAQAWRRPVQA